MWPNFVLIGQVVSEEKIFEWKVTTDGWTDGRRTQSDGKISPWLQPGELKRVSSSNLSDCSYVEIHIPHATKLRRGTCKMRNEIETKRNETKRNKSKRNSSKRNEIYRNETKSKRNEVNFVSFRWISFRFISFRFVSISFRILQVYP